MSCKSEDRRPAHEKQTAAAHETGKMILTCRDFDLKSSEMHQEIGKSKAKAMVDELGLAEGIQTQKVCFYEKSSPRFDDHRQAHLHASRGCSRGPLWRIVFFIQHTRSKAHLLVFVRICFSS